MVLQFLVWKKRRKCFPISRDTAVKKMIGMEYETQFVDPFMLLSH